MQSEKQAGKPRDVFCLFGLWIVVTAYNLFKAYHIDDTAYLNIARWIALHPLHPMTGILNWNGVDEPISQTNQPHLFMYLLALWSRIFGFSEPALHSLQSIAALACIFLFYRLAVFFANKTALWLTALMILGPAFIVGQNLMVDVTLLSFWLAFFYLLACQVEMPNQTLRYLGAALACSASLLTKYSSLVLLPILFLSLLLERRKKQWWTALVPLATLAAWSLFNYVDYGAIHIAMRPVASGPHPPFHYAMAWVVTIGGLTPIGLIALVQGYSKLLNRERIIYPAVALGFTALVLAVAWDKVPQSWSTLLLWIAFAINGAIALAWIVPPTINVIRRQLWDREVARQAAPMAYLVSWIAVTSVFYILFSPFIAARHVLLILPPLLLLMGTLWNNTLSSDSRIFGLAFTIFVSAGLCIRDWRSANFIRSQASVVMREIPGTGTVWTSGHWGWQWYAETAGMREIDIVNSRLLPGDSFVIAQSTDRQELRFVPPPMHLVQTDLEPSSGWDLFCTRYFYGSPGARVTPWYLSRSCRNRIDVFHVDSR